MPNQIKPRPVITTRNLHEHTAQEVFDFVCLKVIEQGQRAFSRASCVYLTTAGLKCAVGHLIDDPALAARLNDVGGLKRWREYHFRGVGWAHDSSGVPAHLSLLVSLQGVHDRASGLDFVTEFRARARETAQRFHLDPHILDVAEPLEM